MEERLAFATRLRQAREAVGVSQKQLGIRAGIDQFVASARINQYERGKHLPDPLMACRLAQELGIPVSFLYEPDDELAELIRLIGKLTATNKRLILKQLSDKSVTTSGIASK